MRLFPDDAACAAYLEGIRYTPQRYQGQLCTVQYAAEGRYEAYTTPTGTAPTRRT